MLEQRKTMMKLQAVNGAFAVSPQLQPSDVAETARISYRGVTCARPDREDPGQPAFAEIAMAAERAGLKAFHVPVSGPLTDDHLLDFAQALATIDGPVVGYCRSGGRARRLYDATR